MKRFTYLAALVAVFLFNCGAAPRPPRDVGEYLISEKGSQVLKLTRPSNHGAGGTGFSAKTMSGQVVTITNAHICEAAENGMLAAQREGSNGWTLLKVIEKLETTDLCVVEGMYAASGLELARSFNPREMVYFLGHPYLKPLTLTSGYAVERGQLELLESIDDVEACAKRPGRVAKDVMGFFGPQRVCINMVDAWDTSVTTHPGNSGSPAFNKDGDVVGVVFAADNRTNFGSFIPLETLRALLMRY